MGNFDEMVKSLTKTIKKAGETKTQPYDAEGTVTRTEGDIAWVHLPGGVAETPVKMTVAAKEGQRVQVRVSGGRAFLVGNASAPPTDDTTALIAKGAADNAVVYAEAARQSAESAQASADAAGAAAAQAIGDASRAAQSANEAMGSANSAADSASQALFQLGIVQDVVGVFNWMARHGQYVLTTDTEVNPNKFYFTYDAESATYVLVNAPEGDPQAQGWYELDHVEDTVSQYIQTHAAITERGLWLQTTEETNSSKVLVSPTEGIILYGTTGREVARYGETARIGSPEGFHIEIDGTELGFYEGMTRVAYINNNRLHIAQSVVLNEMQLGANKWTWKLDPNNDGLYLKWIGG